MPHPVCSLCTHPRRAEIDADLLGGQSTTAVAKKYGGQQTTFARHLRLHLKPHVHAIARAAGPMLLPPPTPQAQAAMLIPSIGGLLDKLGTTIDRAEKLVADAEADGSIPARAVSLNALKGALVDTAKLLAMLGPQGPRNVTPEQIDRSALADLFASADVDSKQAILERLLP
jgi:hypothetical protein